MSIRTRIFGPGADEPLLRTKSPKGAKADMLDSVAVSRRESRRGNARGNDRHRLTAEQALLRHGGAEEVVELVNVSAGGAMVRGKFAFALWDQVSLVLGDEGAIDCAVRWLRDDRAGLEFAHETRIDCAPDERDELLRAVIRRSFPDLEIALDHTEGAGEQAPFGLQKVQARSAERHPLVWNGIIYYDDTHDFEAEPVRLRNVSATGALVQSGNPLPEGRQVYLDMRAAGRHAAVVKWTRGDQSGLQFTEAFDLQQLALAAPEVTSAQSSVAAFGNQEPWAPGWKRSTMSELARSLAG